MHIIYAPGPAEPSGPPGFEVEVRPRSRDVTLADLFRALGAPDPGHAMIDGRVVASATPIAGSGLHEGAVLTPAGPARDPRPVPVAAEVVTVGGLRSGRVFPLPPGQWLVGRSPQAGVRLEDETVSREHCVLSVGRDAVGVTDLGAANGVQINGVSLREPTLLSPGDVLGVGAVALAVRRPGDADRPAGLDLRRHLGPGGTVSFNRPPRSAPPAAPDEMTAPPEPREPSKPHFSLASTLGPLVLAVIMVAVTRDLRFGLFALLSPLIGIGTYVESLRRNRKEAAEGRRTFAAELDALDERIAAAGAVERDRLRHILADPAEALRRAELPSTRLWERRPHHEDFLLLHAGLADRPWTPPVRADGGRLPDAVAERIAAARLPAAPIEVNLGGGGVVGIAGDRDVALAVARSLLCQAAVHHGPADLTIGVFVDDGREPVWDWCKWLPHTRLGDDSGQWLSHRRDRSDAMLRQLAAESRGGTTLVVLDSGVLTEGVHSPARDLLNAARIPARTPFDQARPVPVAGIVLAATADRLPAACDTVIEIAGPDGDATVRRPAEGTAVANVLLAGLAVDQARAGARRLARFDDPELRRTGAGLPDGVRLLPMLGLSRIEAEAIRERWRRTDPETLAAPLGMTGRGVFTLDLIRDGPHGLIGGTTGSGKSELLRSLVAALAANAGPQQLTFVLMDYKGGAAFDECARLPHTVGLVTDLDEQLGERALRALEAELRRRERRLREVRADNLIEYVRSGAAVDHPMPRLVVVIDEFATMAKELPDFLTALVGIAQRGRTLGVHLILATQRPSGAVNDNIRTNTNLRVALRVQDAADSIDVIGVRDAAELSRLLPGRAYVRLGPGEVVPIQTALVTTASGGGDDAPVAVTPFVFGAAAEPRTPAMVESPSRTDLARLVDAVAEAAGGLPAPHRPWPEPLTADLDLATLPPSDSQAVAALADDPDNQRQHPIGWDPADGNLLLLGITGSGTTTTLIALALSLAVARPPEQLEIYAVDYGTGDLAALEALPHTGSVIAADDRERQVRLIRHLRAELDRRRSGGPPRRPILVLIDNLSAMRAEFDDVEGLALLDVVTRVYADGTAAGIWFAVTADRFSTVPAAWISVTTQRWLFRLPDPYDYVQAGLSRKDVPARVPGRLVALPSGLQAQVGRPSPSAAAMAALVAAKYPDAPRVAARIGVLPSAVSVADLPAPALGEEPWRVPIGVQESDLGAAALVLYEGDHALIAGPARSGKSTALLTLAAVLRGRAFVAAIGGRRSPLRSSEDVDRFADPGGPAAALLADLRGVTGPAVLLVDDAEGLDDADGALAGLLGAGLPDLHVIAAGRADGLRTLYGHWTQTVRRGKAGLLLRPNIDLDGDLLGVTLPRRAPVRVGVGRGYLIHNGEWDITQVARP
ncbi:FtsK/SpoIIIE domain-containing protein [Actinoplanes missouriensis]|uniref:FtsK/SpoIIIE domain-containing protein n=1 Tax=Actinoplanes missouriensis TaxID=1866 RepID=UPI0033F82B08